MKLIPEPRRAQALLDAALGLLAAGERMRERPEDAAPQGWGFGAEGRFEILAAGGRPRDRECAGGADSPRQSARKRQKEEALSGVLRSDDADDSRLGDLERDGEEGLLPSVAQCVSVECDQR